MNTNLTLMLYPGFSNSGLISPSLFIYCTRKSILSIFWCPAISTNLYGSALYTKLDRSLLNSGMKSVMMDKSIDFPLLLFVVIRSALIGRELDVKTIDRKSCHPNSVLIYCFSSSCVPLDRPSSRIMNWKSLLVVDEEFNRLIS